MKVFHVSWNHPEVAFHEMPWKKNFTVYPSLKINDCLMNKAAVYIYDLHKSYNFNLSND